ncbi:MAG: RNA polymerase sigma factor [Bacteroidaceae bacterium]|nr:RNA polymerase sigma factor [Bacteroidaceae bacterium]MBQ8365189.1 RNA polymerase sigma factor [Bacteroidaceae bacterium]
MNTVNFKRELLEAQSELQRFAYKLTNDKEEANDLLQETSLKALVNSDKYEPDTNFKGWLFTIMRNIFINNYRKVTREQTFVDSSENLFQLNQAKESEDYIAENDYDLKEIKKAINSLSDEMRIPFVMHIKGYKYREIADKLALPLGTVKSRIFFSRRILQEELKDFI